MIKLPIMSAADELPDAVYNIADVIAKISFWSILGIMAFLLMIIVYYFISKAVKNRKSEKKTDTSDRDERQKK